MRPPDFVMSAARAAAVVPNALSFPRATMRELVRDRYRIEKLRFELDARGRGEILYRLTGGRTMLHFFLVSDELPEEQKTDRNFAQSWDAMGVLCEGEWNAEREGYLRREVPKQRAGYADYDTLIYARGNRSKRVFDHVVDSLAAGHQPDLALIAPIGYILRTTAFIGNGALGTKPWAGLAPGHPLRRPYHVQFCSAFALREFVFDLVDHIARARSPRAVRLAPAYRRYLGLGNSAATGLAAFAANHPHFLHRWTLACEQALARASSRAVERERFLKVLDKAIRYHVEGAHDSDGVFATPQSVASDLARLRDAAPFASWPALREWAQGNLCGEACEVTGTILLELYPDIVSAFTDAFEADERCEVLPAMRIAQMRSLLQAGYGWALALAGDDSRYFWYRSSSAPRDVRRGVRGRATDLEAETTMDTVLQARMLATALQDADADSTVATLVHRHPGLRHIVGRVQALAHCEYGELRQQMLAPDYSPFATIRYPLAFFGMEKFEAARPKSVRGVFMQGAPIAEDVAAGHDGAWPFPLLPGTDADDDSSMLAPLPGATTRYRAPSHSTFDAAAPLRIAPGELARMVQTSLQGHGMPLGVAEDAAKLVAFAHARGEPGIAAHLRDCGRKGAYDTAFEAHAVEARLVVLDAAGRSTLACAASALDFAVAAAANCGFGTTLAARARDGWLAEELALRASADGLIGFVLWRAEGGCGFAAGGPGTHGPWFVSGRTLRDDAFGGEDGFLVACARTDAMQSTAALLDALASSARASVLWDENAVREHRAAWAREGLAITRVDFDALAMAGRTLLVPQDEEARVLDPGVDPLKTF